MKPRASPLNTTFSVSWQTDKKLSGGNVRPPTGITKRFIKQRYRIVAKSAKNMPNLTKILGKQGGNAAHSLEKWK